MNVVNVVIVIRDVIDVGNACIADVDALEVVSAYTVIRDIRFTVSEWKPANTDAGAADPRHERRRVAGAHTYRSGDPTPSSSYKHPAAIVEGRESPSGIIHPRPAPRFNPSPMPIPVGCPSHFDPGGKPHTTIGTDLSPGAILVKIFVADHVRRYIA